MTTAFTELRAAEISVNKSCALTGTSRATHYRHVNPKGPMHGPWLPRHTTLACPRRHRTGTGAADADQPGLPRSGDPAGMGT